MLIPAVKGIFLIGILSWYSAAIFGMINNYFRSEFKEYIKKNPIEPTSIKNLKSNQIEIASSIIEITPTPTPMQSSHPLSIISEPIASFDEYCTTIASSNKNVFNGCIGDRNFHNYTKLMINIHQCTKNLKLIERNNL